MKKFLFLIGIGILILLASFGVMSSFRGSVDERTGSGMFSSEIEDAQKNTRPVFTHPIVDPATISFITPLGELNGGYEEVQTLAGVMMNFKREVVEGNKEIEVYAPTDMILESYSFHIVPFPPGGQWALIFRLSKDVTMRIDHISRASDAIQQVTTTIPKESSTEDYPKTKLKFKAGEIIGYTFGTVPAHNWNIYVFDTKQKNNFINQMRYEKNRLGERLDTAVCPFDYYEDQGLKNIYYALLGASQPGQTASCGSPSKDKIDTLSGLWHLKKEGRVETGYEGDFANPLSVYKRSDNNVVIHEIGRKRVIISPGMPTYKNPEEVTSSHCYNLTDDWSGSMRDGYIYFRIDSDTEMSVAYNRAGSCPTMFPTVNIQKYYR